MFKGKTKDSSSEPEIWYADKLKTYLQILYEIILCVLKITNVVMKQYVYIIHNKFDKKKSFWNF
jgi:hypothetical protein